MTRDDHNSSTADLGPLRLGILFEYPTLNGGEQSLLAALDAMSPDQIHPIAIVTERGPLTSALHARAIPTETVALSDQTGHRITARAWAERLTTVVDRHALQLLHANSLAMGRTLGRASPELNCPTTAHLRDIIKLSLSAIEDLNRHRELFAVSDATRDFHIGPGLDAERVTTFYNGVDTKTFRPRPRSGSLHDELGLPGQTPLAAAIGQICLRKGQLDFAQAALLLRETLPELHFLLIGVRHSKKQEDLRIRRRNHAVVSRVRYGAPTAPPRLARRYRGHSE